MEIARCWVFVRKGNRQGAVRWMPVRLEALLKLVLDIIDRQELERQTFPTARRSAKAAEKARSMPLALQTRLLPLSGTAPPAPKGTDCQKLSLRPPTGNAPAQYHRGLVSEASTSTVSCVTNALTGPTPNPRAHHAALVVPNR